MQTIVKLVCDNRGQSQMIEDYLAAFCSRFADETAGPEFTPPDSDDVAFAMDDCPEIRDWSFDEPNAILGSFRESLHLGNEKTQFIFINPVIVSYRPNGGKLRLWVGSPSLGDTGRRDFE